MRSNPCPLCAHANPVTARSCEACGVGMVATCQHCGAINDTTALRCLRCDATLPAGEGIADGPDAEASTIVAADAKARATAFDAAAHSVPLLPVQMRVRFNRDRTLDLEWPDGHGGVILHTIHPPDTGSSAPEAPWIRLDTASSVPALVPQPQRPAQTAVAVIGQTPEPAPAQAFAPGATAAPRVPRSLSAPLISAALAGGMVVAAAFVWWPRDSAVTSGVDAARPTAARTATPGSAAVTATSPPSPDAAVHEPARQTVGSASAPGARTVTDSLPAKTEVTNTVALQAAAKAAQPATAISPATSPAISAAPSPAVLPARPAAPTPAATPQAERVAAPTGAAPAPGAAAAVAASASAASPQQAIEDIDENPPSAGRRAQAARPAHSAAVHKPGGARTAAARNSLNKPQAAAAYAPPPATKSVAPVAAAPTSATGVAAVLGTQAPTKPAAQELPLRLSGCSNSVAALGLCNVGSAANPAPRKE